MVGAGNGDRKRRQRHEVGDGDGDGDDEAKEREDAVRCEGTWRPWRHGNDDEALVGGGSEGGRE